MHSSALPKPLTTASPRSGAVHASGRNEVVARDVRLAALELEAERVRERYAQKYSFVSPRVTTRSGSPRAHHSVSPQQHDVITDDDDIARRLVVPEKPHVGQVVCDGDGRQFARDDSQAVISSWDQLNVPRRVLEAHDTFLVTAGRVKPYMTITDNIINSSGSSAAPVRITQPPLDLRKELGHNPWLTGVRRGLSHIKGVAGLECSEASLSPRSLKRTLVPRSPRVPLPPATNKKTKPTAKGDALHGTGAPLSVSESSPSKGKSS